jgi:hypothetical protein
MVGDLAQLLLDVSVERDWVPTCIHPAHLPFVNEWMGRIDLICETGAPVFAACSLYFFVAGSSDTVFRVS